MQYRGLGNLIKSNYHAGNLIIVGRWLTMAILYNYMVLEIHSIVEIVAERK